MTAALRADAQHFGASKTFGIGQVRMGHQRTAQQGPVLTYGYGAFQHFYGDEFAQEQGGIASRDETRQQGVERVAIAGPDRLTDGAAVKEKDL